MTESRQTGVLEVMGWKDVTMLRRYIAAVAGELAQEAHDRFSPGDAIGLRQLTTIVLTMMAHLAVFLIRYPSG